VSWTSILTALTLAAAAAYLVLSQEWTVREAFFAVRAAAVALIISLLGSLFLFAKKQNRPDLRREIASSIRQDFGDALRWFRLK